MKRSVTIILAAIMLIMSFASPAFAAAPRDYGYTTLTLKLNDTVNEVRGISAKLSVPYYLGTVDASLKTVLGTAESEVLVLYIPNDKWDGDCAYSVVSASIKSPSHTILSGIESVPGWRDMYTYGFLDFIGGMYSFDDDSMQLHITEGPGVYTALATLPYVSGNSSITDYAGALAAGMNIEYTAIGYNFILVLNDDMIDYFLENGKLETASSYEWPGLKELLLGAQYSMRDAVGLKNFRARNSYNPGQFLDVPYNRAHWFDNYVRKACELGLMNGYTDNTFKPDGNITLAECIAIAAKMNNIYYGGNGEFTGIPGSRWYDSFVDYCLENNIIKPTDFIGINDNPMSVYDRPATRGELAYILASALPEEAYKNISAYNYLKDVNSATPYDDEIYTLYGAGVISGYPNGTFGWDRFITRAEISTIISKIADETLRGK